ncbi:class II aldolase/adducin family protein [Cupriavidus basilensis]
MAVANCHPAEWEARVKLAACYRIFDRLGWTELIYNHITLRLPPEAGGDTGKPLSLINPFGLRYAEVTASNLVKIDLAGQVVGESPWPVNPRRLRGACGDSRRYSGRALRDAYAHHGRHGGERCSAQGLSMSNFYAAQLFDKVAYHPFEGITVHDEEGPRLVRNIGDKPAVILRNHGLLAWGDSIARTFSTLWLLNRACEIQLATLAMGAALPVPEEIQRKCTRDSLQFNPKFGAGEDVFAALIREIDAIDDSHRN